MKLGHLSSSSLYTVSLHGIERTHIDNGNQTKEDNQVPDSGTAVARTFDFVIIASVPDDVTYLCLFAFVVFRKLRFKYISLTQRRF